MDRVRTERSATRRVLGRALLVLGGAAAAWALGTATASADTGVDFAEDLGAAIESAPLPDSPFVAGGKAAVVDLVDRTLTVLHVEDGAKAVDEFGKTVAKHFSKAATPGQRVDNLLPDLPDLSRGPAPPRRTAPSPSRRSPGGRSPCPLRNRSGTACPPRRRPRPPTRTPPPGAARR
ncbi:hypothetical protein ACFQV2_38515 [Actinokineospora soli]|uniref:Uncharacterized protein n=1 Tax=Actinokineospora soli TaxID=1048753 RepID=A0ABW2TZT2_9PSEU